MAKISLPEKAFPDIQIQTMFSFSQGTLFFSFIAFTFIGVMYILICLFHLISSPLRIISSMKAGIISVTVFSHSYIQNSSSCPVI